MIFQQVQKQVHNFRRESQETRFSTQNSNNHNAEAIVSDLRCQGPVRNCHPLPRCDRTGGDHIHPSPVKPREGVGAAGMVQHRRQAVESHRYAIMAQGVHLADGRT